MRTSAVSDDWRYPRAVVVPSADGGGATIRPSRYPNNGHCASIAVKTSRVTEPYARVIKTPLRVTGTLGTRATGVTCAQTPGTHDAELSVALTKHSRCASAWWNGAADLPFVHFPLPPPLCAIHHAVFSIIFIQGVWRYMRIIR